MSEPNAASHNLPLRNCYWVVPGLLLAGEHPNGPTRDKTKDRLKKLLGAGIECFVDLTKPTELLRYDTFLPFYVEYTRKSIKDHGTPGSRSQMVEILEHIANSMRAGRPVYVHCRAGIGRTGTVVGCLLAERGLLGNAAIDELNRLWQQCRRSRSWPVIPETDAQAHYVREWQPSLAGGFDLNSLATAVATVGSMTADGGLRADSPAGAGRRAGDVGKAGASARGPGTGAGGGATGAAGGAAGAATSARGGQSGAAAGITPGSGAASARAGRSGGAGASARETGRSASVGSAAGAPGSGAGRDAGSAGASARGSGSSAGVGRDPGSAGAGASARGSGSGPGVGRPGASGSSAPAGNGRAAEQPAAVVSAAGSAGGIGAGLRAAAEQARAAVERGDVQVKAPPAPVPTSTPAGAGGASKPWRAAADARAERGEIAPSIRAEIADAISGRSTQATDAPNGAEEAAWVEAAAARAYARTNGHDESQAESDVASAEPATRPSGRTSQPNSRLQSESAPSIKDRSPASSGDAFAGRTSGDAGVGSRTAGGRQAPAAVVEQPAESDPLLDADTLAAARGLRERFVGALFGLAVGDAIAAATQFRRPGTFSPIGDMLGGGPFDLPRGAWSDDTAMALCLAESLLERDGFDARDQVQRYSRWQQDGYMTSTGQCVGITASTARSLALAQWRRGMVFPGSHDPEQLDPEPLSRIAAVALFYFASLEQTLQQSVDSSRITCQAPAVLDACRRFGRALTAALAGQSKAKILAEAGPVSEAAAQVNNTAGSALSAAFWAFSSTDNYRDAVLRAANVGGNSDVVAAVCGQLAGAHYGATAIPQSWRSGLMEKDLIEGIADRLLAHALVSLSS